MLIEPVTLTGVRAQLVPLATSHLDALTAAGARPETWEFFPWRLDHRDAMKAHIDWLLEEQSQGHSLPFTIIDQLGSRIVGSTRFHTISKANRSLEIGTTWLHPDVWRTGVNIEAKYLLLRHAFEHWQAVRVQIKTDVHNLRSQRAIERLGAVREGVLRQHWILPSGRIRDSVLYSIVQDEWPAVREGLAARLSR